MTLLREERERRGWDRPKLVRELQQLAKLEGAYLASSDSLIRMSRRWEATDGPPDEPYRSLLCKLYGRSEEEFGWQHPAGRQPTTVGLNYASSLESTADALVSLSTEDVGANQALLVAPYDPNAPTGAALDWLFGSVSDDLIRGGATVTAADVAEIRNMTHTLDMLDRQFGGEHSRRTAAQYLRDRVMPRLRNRCSGGIARDLFAATAVLCELIGWMAYDAGRHSVAQRYFVQALRVAQAAGDRAYGAYVLASMSDQALFLGHSGDALRLARAARDTNAGVPTVLTEATMLEARALAKMGERSQCVEALGRAEQAFSLIRPDERPDWSGAFDEVVFASHAGTCWVDLGQAAPAREHIDSALGRMAGQARRRVYGTIQLAKIALIQHDLDQACTLGIEAVDAVNGLASHRSVRHLTDLGRLLEPHDSAPVRSYLDRLQAVMAAKQ